MRTNVTTGSFVPGNESAWERNVPVPFDRARQNNISSRIV